MARRLERPRLITAGCLLLIAVALLSGHPGAVGASEAAQFEWRCGWLDNPTPANVWLYDREGRWTIGVQGGHQAEGDLPAPGPGQWVRTNVGEYGYGCACLQVRVNKETHEVLEIKSGRARTLAACRRDRSLRRWRHMFK
jgi:hypothetical protein